MVVTLKPSTFDPGVPRRIPGSGGAQAPPVFRTLSHKNAIKHEKGPLPLQSLTPERHWSLLWTNCESSRKSKVCKGNTTFTQLQGF